MLPKFRLSSSITDKCLLLEHCRGQKPSTPQSAALHGDLVDNVSDLLAWKEKHTKGVRRGRNEGTGGLEWKRKV